MTRRPDPNIAGGDAGLAPLYACVLIGGQSTRMGTPKHLLPVSRGTGILSAEGAIRRGEPVRPTGVPPVVPAQAGDYGRDAPATSVSKDSEPVPPSPITWVERTVALLSPFAVRVVLSGAGEVPPSLAGMDRIPDALNVHGPMAGILACMRWAPHAAWLVAACDLIRLDHDALRWLVGCRRVEAWAVLPRLECSPRVEPTLACYEPPVGPLLAHLASAGQFHLAGLVGSARTLCPTVPRELRHAWHNANTPDDLLRA